MFELPENILILFVATWTVLGAVSTVLMITLRRQRATSRRLEALLAGTAGGNLEQVLLKHVDQIRQNERHIDQLGRELASHKQLLESAIQHVALVRYNPFEDTGGQFSFALALADDNGDGMVVSSLHGRGGTRVYAKNLQHWDSAHRLSDEEREAIRLSRQRALDGPVSTQRTAELDRVPRAKAPAAA